MLLSVVLSLSFILILIFFTTPKKLTTLEHMFNYMVLIIILMNLVFIFDANIKYLKIPKEFDLFLASRLIILLLIPLVVMFFLDILYSIKSYLFKILIIILSLSILIAIDYTSSVFRIFIIKNWQLSNVSLFWSIFFLTTYILHKLFRNYFLKGAKQ